ncbi:MAG TPA: SpoIIE family protein phosphatase, partial [Bacteroidia bacterium]
VKQGEILDSIRYAKRIQNALFLNNDLIKEHFPDNFIVFKPKDIVSGDFYWTTKSGSKFYLAVCDSTGHGVPGAFMSLLNVTFLNEAINEKGIDSPERVFDFVRQRLVERISQEGAKDGMDGILICWDTQKEQLTYAAANNTPFLVRGKDGKEWGADRMPIGKGESASGFKLNQVEFQKGDRLYLFTDGYADQFGGPKGKKFRYKQLQELLVSSSDLTFEEQSRILETTIVQWKGDLEQTDDILVIGIGL